MLASFIQCQQWANKSLKKVNMQDLFRSLCVLDKQTVMPKSMFSNLWRLSSREPDDVVQTFADLGLVTKTINQTSDDYDVHQHDFVLCQEIAVDEQEERHENVIRAFKHSKSMWISEEIPKLEE